MKGSLRIWGLVSGAAIVAVLAGGWFVGVQPQIAAAATADTAAVGVNAQSQATRIRLTELTKLAAKSEAMRAEDVVLQKAVPQILKPNTFIRRTNEVAALDGVTVQAVTPGASAAYTAPPSLITGQPSDGSVAPPALAKTDPSITAANFTVVPMTVVVAGSSDAILQFTHDIQNDERVFLITSMMTTTDDTGLVSATLSGYIYTLKR